jgi:tetratricopeptide (TPR) repeat protein
MVSLCLNMIVKNESKIITRMLDSVIDIIDTYCICDTGSTDNTIEIINEYFNEKNMLGKIIIEPFVNFEYNRNFALNECLNMSDYILLMDADMVLEVINFDKSVLTNNDVFYIFQGSDDFYNKNIRIIKNNNSMKYLGVTHEYLDIRNNVDSFVIPSDDLFIYDIGDGGCKLDKYKRDIQLLLDGIKNDNTNSRYYFYLANSYYDSEDYMNAINTYITRISMGGWIQEIWYSYFRIGLSYYNLGEIDNAIKYWLEAYNCYPDRVENLYYIMKYYRENEKYILAKMYYDIIINIISKLDNNKLNDYLFLHNDIYTTKIYYEYSIIAYYLEIINMDDTIIQILNTTNDIDIVNTTLSNMKFYKNILKTNKYIDLYDNISVNINDVDILFHSSSPSIIKHNNNYILNIRYVNYAINNDGSYMYNNSIFTINKYVKYDTGFNIIKEKIFGFEQDNIVINDSILYGGIEDLKLYNSLNFIGTIILQDSICMSYGRYDIDNDKLDYKLLTADFELNNVEKNWVFTTYKNKEHIIYKWYPLTICELNENESKIYMVVQKEMPNIFRYVRGSSSCSIYNNELWFVVHIVSYESPRHYYHMLVKFDTEMNLICYSAPFKFEDSSIEFCIGLLVENEGVIMTYSVMDNKSILAYYNIEYINSIMKYTVECQS